MHILAYSILNDTVSQELCNIHYIVHIYTSSISISISYLFDFHFVFTPATCPCVLRRRVSFLQGFFSQISIKKPVFFFTLSILPGFRKKRNRIFTMQKKKTLGRFPVRFNHLRRPVYTLQQEKVFAV